MNLYCYLSWDQKKLFTKGCQGQHFNQVVSYAAASSDNMITGLSVWLDRVDYQARSLHMVFQEFTSEDITCLHYYSNKTYKSNSMALSMYWAWPYTCCIASWYSYRLCSIFIPIRVLWWHQIWYQRFLCIAMTLNMRCHTLSLTPLQWCM